MARFTTSTSISIRHRHGYVFSGTSHRCANEHLDDIVDELTSCGLTVSVYREVSPMVALPASDTTFNFPIFQAPAACTVAAVYLVSSANIVGQDTDYLTVSAINKGTAGAGTPILVTKTMNAAGGTVVGLVPTSLGTISGVATMAANEVLVITKGTAGTGLSFPASVAYVETIPA